MVHLYLIFGIMCGAFGPAVGAPIYNAYALVDPVATPNVIAVQPLAINNLGDVVGEYARLSSVSQQRAFLIRNGAFIDLGDFGGGRAVARDINDLGEIVGYSWLPNSTARAFIWANGQMTELPLLSGTNPTISASFALGINNIGQVVGEAVATNGQLHAFLYDSGVISDIAPPGTLNSRALDINNSGQVIVRGEYSDGRTHPFLYENGLTTDLGIFGGSYASPYDINNLGEILVGIAPNSAAVYTPIENYVIADTTKARPVSSTRR